MLPWKSLGLAVAFAALGAACGGSNSTIVAPEARPAPKVSGPITSGTRGHAFAATLVDLDEFAYVEEEYFIEGAAVAYEAEPGTTLGEDGQWQVQERESAPFKTRILVARPRDDAGFSGNVMVQWLNVTAGFEINGSTESAFRRGDAMVAVSAQEVGINGIPGGEANALLGWDPERYGTLEHPGDDYSFDIFSQALRAVGPERATSTVDPMGGLEVEHVFAFGGSQSAIRLNSYLNGVQPIEGLLDGALLFVSFGYSAPFDSEASGQDEMMLTRTRIRGDLDIPVLLVTTETEAVTYLPMRQPDTDRFRAWEIAGAAHAGAAGALEDIVNVFIRDGLQIPPGLGSGGGLPPGVQPNSVSYLPVGNAAWKHLFRWAEGGEPPPSFHFIEFSGDPQEIVRDEHGNALGGLRMPELEVPIATYTGTIPGVDPLLGLSGTTTPFPREKLQQLYRDRADYLHRYEEAVNRGVEQEFFLAEDVEAIVAAAAEHAATVFPE